jgi:hypothetical protein
MLLIPELKTVVILTPRTGSRALKNAVLATYPDAMLLYRHMEADGVPQGYDRWRKVGIVRNPVQRLWSLYKYLQHIGLDWCLEHDAAYTADLRASVAVPFEEWLVRNEVPFTTPYDRAGRAGSLRPTPCATRCRKTARASSSICGPTSELKSGPMRGRMNCTVCWACPVRSSARTEPPA